MKCTSPRTVGFHADGKTIAWSQKYYDKQYATFQLPCGKCLACRLEYARQWAIRCVHEAQMHEENCFVTLTYDNENLGDNKLNYSDFQLFMKRLRFAYPNKQIGFFATGEYGEKTKRKHWHACIFGWSPRDARYKYSNDRGDKIYESEHLSQLWGKGITEYGSVTFESAGYCARYAAKKLGHGHDDSHEFNPISKKSSKNAIGKKWLEQHFNYVFNHGHIILPNGAKCGIPRYYEKWLKKNHPEKWVTYVQKTKADRARDSVARELRDQSLRLCSDTNSKTPRFGTSRHRAEKTILEQKFKILQNNIKL